MPAIFISHASVDNKLSDEIKSWLAGLGFEQIFLDFDKESGIGAGEDWEKRLYAEVSRCHAVILLLTPSWMESKWCFVELSQARALGKMIIPAICAPLGDKHVLPSLQSVDLIDWRPENLSKIERLLHSIVDELARGFSLPPGRPPYPGIHAFQAEDAATFFGRDAEIRRVLEKLDARRNLGGTRFLLMVGASGAGKSSLLKAGVMMQLQRRRRDWICVPPMRPGRRPLDALAKSLSQLAPGMSWQQWAEVVRTPEASNRIARLTGDLQSGIASNASFILAVDQFEEVFTVASVDEKVHFLRLLTELLDPSTEVPIFCIGTARADVLHGLLEESVLAPFMDTISLPPMPLDQIPTLIAGPASVASLNVESGLIDRIKADIGTPEALPLLAHLLANLYFSRASPSQITIHDYSVLGDAALGLNPIQNSVRLAVDQALAGMSPKPSSDELSALRDCFVTQLVRLSAEGQKYVRQPASVKDLSENVKRLINALVEARVLTQANDGYTIEISHEAIFAAWPTLKRWLEEEHAFLADLARLEAAHLIWTSIVGRERNQALLHGFLLSRATQWLSRYPDRFDGPLRALRSFIHLSQRAAKRQQWRSTVVIGTLMIAAALGWIGWVQHDAARSWLRWYLVQAPYARDQTRHALSAEADKALKPGESFRECGTKLGVCPEMVVIPPGLFKMGSEEGEAGRQIDEGPTRSVTISRRFAVAKYELTFEEWDTCVSYGDCPAGISDSGFGRGRRPAINITYLNAQTYVSWLARVTGKPYRLLTEAEFEYATRAGAASAYPWGDEVGTGNANCNKCSSPWDFKETAPVGSFPPNRFGLHDMVGNVFEWVSDCYANNYAGAPSDGSARDGPNCRRRPVRGGSWNFSPNEVRSAARGLSSITSPASFVGVRIGRNMLDK